jgi:lipopolysaccharide transport system ATP-binding protein
VAAHLEPEILLVDEVLAVGDAEFQKKCLGKMGEVAKEGRTVLFVSHNMTAIQNLCPRTFQLHSGKIVSDGKTEEVVNKYLEITKSEDIPIIYDRIDRTGDGRLRFYNFEVLTQDEKLKTGEPVIFRLHYRLGFNGGSCKNVAFSFSINHLSGNHMLVFYTEETRSSIAIITKNGYIDCVIPDFPLASGTYVVNLYVTVNGILADYVLNAAQINVDDSSFYINGGSRHPDHPLYVCQHKWIENGNPSLIQR